MARAKKEAEPTIDPWALKQLDYMQHKLEAVGATPGEVDEFTAQWLDPEWDHDEKVRLLSMGDAKLRREVHDTRAQALFDTTTESEEAVLVAQQDEADRLNVIEQEAAEISALEPHDVLEWAGDDRERLDALWNIETAHPTPRAELVEQIEQLLA